MLNKYRKNIDNVKDTTFWKILSSETLAESLRLLYSFAIKWQPFNFLAKFVKNALYLASIFQFRNYQIFVFDNVRNMRNKQQVSGKLRSRKGLV